MNPENETATKENTAPTTEDSAQEASTEGTVQDAGVAEAPAPNEAQATAAAILAARSAGKAARSAGKAAKEPKAPKAPKEPGEAKAPKPEGLVKTGYRFLRDIDPASDKLNNQQAIIIEEMLKLRGEDGDLKDVVLREPLIKALQDSKMVTRQPHERVFGFYLNAWKKSFEATEKKPAIPALLEVVKITLKS